MKTYKESRQAALAALKENPKAIAGASTVAIVGTTALAVHVATLTTTTVAPGAFGAGTIGSTTVAATLLSKVIVATIGVAAISAATYYTYKYIQSKTKK